MAGADRQIALPATADRQARPAPPRSLTPVGRSYRARRPPAAQAAARRSEDIIVIIIIIIVIAVPIPDGVAEVDVVLVGQSSGSSAGSPAQQRTGQRAAPGDGRCPGPGGCPDAATTDCSIARGAAAGSES
jgi:hypothetical protein